MERISGTSRTNNNLKRNPNYASNARKTNGMTAIDSLKYQEVLKAAIEERKEARDSANDVNKFKSLIEKAGEKLTSQLTAAPLREDTYSREASMMMANGGMAAKARVERKPIEEELSRTTVKKRAINSYTTSYGQYRRDLVNTDITYKNYEDTSKDSRGYKNNYSDYTKVRNNNISNEVEDTVSLTKQTEKVSFWSKLKNAIKNFFKTEEKERESIGATSIQPRIDKAAQYRKSVPKAAPQINKEEIERKRLQKIREMAIKAR